MSKQDDMAVERRRMPRVRPKGTAVVHGASRALLGRIENLSLGGMCIRVEQGSRDLIPDFAQRQCQVDLRLDGARAQWLRLIGTAIRTTPELLVVRFSDRPPALESLIRDELAGSLHNARSPGVIIVDGDATRRARIAEAFRSAGLDPIEVGTPLEAIVRVGEASYEPYLIAVADTEAAEAAEELRGFLRARHPQARIITVGTGARPTDAFPRHSDWLDALDSHGDLDARVRRLLAQRP